MLPNFSWLAAILGPIWRHPSPSSASSNGIYNSSTTPSSLPWNTYNYCNAPHVNKDHYNHPTNAELVHLTVFMRHHKRTPDNLYPLENNLNPASGWDCSNFIQQNYPLGGSPISHQTEIPPSHPFHHLIWNGSCDAGQLTEGGLKDSIKHGQDFRSVYHDTLPFLQNINQNEIYLRTSTQDRTYQVSSGFFHGMDPSLLTQSPLRAHTQPANIDSLVPSYPCPHASSLRNTYQSPTAKDWHSHLLHNSDLKVRLERILGTEGLDAWDSWYDHYFDTFTARTCNGHSLPCNIITGECVSQSDADRVHSLGDWEYDYIFNSASDAKQYVQLTFGVMLTELSSNFRAFISNKEPYKLRVYVGHDGSIIRLISALGVGRRERLRWPAFGSEVIFELWKTNKKKDEPGALFVRVLYEGSGVGGLEWIPLDEFIGVLEGGLPRDIVGACYQ